MTTVDSEQIPLHQESDAATGSYNWSFGARYFFQLMKHVRLWVTFFIVAVVLSPLIYVVCTPNYVANAVVGPPGPSPTNAMMANMSVSGASGTARKLLGAAGGNTSNDPYQEYMLILSSTRLAEALMRRDDFVHRAFPERWDPVRKLWKSGGALGVFTRNVNKLIGRPSSDAPNVDMLTKFFDKHLAIHTVTVPGGTSILTAGTYNTVSFDYRNPRDAEEMLATILTEADNIIREDERGDVVRRVSYFRNALVQPTVAADERTALIGILADQEQLLAVLHADHRYALTLVVTPHASLTPRFPPSPLGLIVFCLLLSTALWVVVVFLGSKIAWMGRIVQAFERSR